MHWTISRWKDWATCPKRYEYRYVLQVAEPGPKSPALLRGIEYHSSIEDFLLGRARRLPPYISAQWQALIKGLKQRKAKAEQQWEFDAGWHPYTHNDTLWLRMKLDANYRARTGVHAVIDFKTGKCYPADSEQIEVYALGTFGMFDDVQQVDGSLWYLDGGEPLDRTIYRPEAPKLARKWEARASQVLDSKTYPARPGRHCGWCPYRKTCPQALGK